MNRELEKLSTVHLSNASPQSPKDPIAHRSDAGTSVRSGQAVEPQLARQPYVEKEAVAIEAEATPIDASEDHRAGVPVNDVVAGPLFNPSVAQDLQARWNEIQVAFVDEPRAAVERADDLVAETTRCLEDSFAAGRRRLESEWDRGGDVSTEALRLAIQRYRTFFNRLLAI
jgi:hypothetical protein